jgi:hypothetical protein
MIADQIALLNRAYSGDEATGQTPTNNPVTRYRFRLYSTDTTVNTAWDWAAQGSREEYDMKRALRKGWPYGLNLYFVNQTVSSQVLGYSTFPWDRGRYPRQDGVVINVRAMPGGDYADFNEGDTATHEIGHWMGLLHTFQGGCSDPNDGVTDTPRERDASSGCPEGADTCVYNPGLDPIHNFMDYSVDACMWEFTAGQAERMDAMWTQYRAS